MRRRHRLTLSALLAAGLASGAAVSLAAAGPDQTPSKPTQLAVAPPDSATLLAQLQALQAQLAKSSGGSAQVRHEIARLQAQLAARRASQQVSAASPGPAGYHQPAATSSARPAASATPNRSAAPATSSTPRSSAPHSTSAAPSTSSTSSEGGHDD